MYYSTVNKLVVGPETGERVANIYDNMKMKLVRKNAELSRAEKLETYDLYKSGEETHVTGRKAWDKVTGSHITLYDERKEELETSHKFTSIRKAFGRYRFHTLQRRMCFLLVLAMHHLYTVPSWSEYALILVDATAACPKRT